MQDQLNQQMTIRYKQKISHSFPLFVVKAQVKVLYLQQEIEPLLVKSLTWQPQQIVVKNKHLFKNKLSVLSLDLQYSL